MITTGEKIKFAELAKKSNVPANLVEILLEDNYVSDNDALKLLSGIRSVKEKGISYHDHEILFNGDNFSRIKKVFDILDDNTLSYLPYVTGNMATALGRYWWD